MLTRPHRYYDNSFLSPDIELTATSAMPFTLEKFCTLRSCAYHVCGAVNFTSIRSSRFLLSASTLLSGTAYEHLLRARRSSSLVVPVNGRSVEIRDHRPLVPRSLSLPDGYTVEDFVGELNARVFFWVGTESGPVRSGKNHIARYASEGAVYILRVPLANLLRANPTEALQVTFCNSGSARHNQGLPAFRSPATFQAPAEASRSAAEVIELTYRAQAILPPETCYSTSLSGPWALL